MNTITLQTHSVYPEILPSLDGNWEAKLITRGGEIKEKFHGKIPIKGKTLLELRAAITKAANLKITRIIHNYEYEK